ILLAQEEECLKQTAAELSCEWLVCDVSDPKAVEKTVSTVVKTHKRVDCLINNAGLWIEGKLEENDPAKVKRAFEVNTFGVTLLSRAVVPLMKKQRSGLIINIVSQAGLNAKPERSIYNASKWAITGFTKCLALELAPFKITVTGVYPGSMQTELFSSAGVNKDLTNAMAPEAVARAVAFVVETDPSVSILELGLKHISQ
ncbi:MAG: SDR family oxidoreductase, partial [Parcubacteria group bacterium]|nr:SDR family oxidoreductase [Parcubacteria group bacterium]